MGGKMLAAILIVAIVLLFFVFVIPSVFKDLPFISKDTVRAMEQSAASTTTYSEVEIEWQPKV